ncbi:DUF6578 domain-containing protein [Spirillospora sp. CA-294931]|uniref:DUF6578 domain-containing protein n=1 Tax=Spirillospora sp. CA-294931 TaxID=3240042 RepID=UPI003D92E450
MIVWVDGWQMQCCGEPFAVGAAVSWELVGPDREWLTSVLGAQTAAVVDGAEERHGRTDGRPVHARVASVEVVHCRFAAKPGAEGLWPVAGSGVRTAVTSVDGREGAEDGLEFVGYLVGLADPAGG